MHLYFIVRGIRHQVELFETFMQAQMFAWKRINVKTGKEEISMVQGSYRDAGPFKEYAFPKEALGEVLTMMHYFSIFKGGGNVGSSKCWLMRKMLGHGVKKIPKIIKPDPTYPIMGLVAKQDGKDVFQAYRYIEMRGLEIVFIGIKDDPEQDYGWGHFQEGL